MSFWEEVDAAFQQVVPVRPKDSFSATEYSIQFGVSEVTARRRLGMMLRAGKVSSLGTFVTDGKRSRLYKVVKNDPARKA